MFGVETYLHRAPSSMGQFNGSPTMGKRPPHPTASHDFPPHTHAASDVLRCRRSTPLMVVAT
ncbi:hypothetical protein L195_g014416 [Trifolium pratense]|uniref:Uncharacterized protein n=1 Tax=Trifolium pratense TaxID=57577 RepID=A0A2K3PQU8_TRIPR|nr:hypothetical protein L195_g014416 [Trifolium pratense]